MQSGQPRTLHADFRPWQKGTMLTRYLLATRMLVAWLYGPCTCCMFQLHIASACWVLAAASNSMCCHCLNPLCVVSPSITNRLCTTPLQCAVTKIYMHFIVLSVPPKCLPCHSHEWTLPNCSMYWHSSHLVSVSIHVMVLCQGNQSTLLVYCFRSKMPTDQTYLQRPWQNWVQLPFLMYQTCHSHAHVWSGSTCHVIYMSCDACMKSLVELVWQTELDVSTSYWVLHASGVPLRSLPAVPDVIVPTMFELTAGGSSNISELLP